MSHFSCWLGHHPALADFQLRALNARRRAAAPASPLEAVSATPLYIVQGDRALEGAERRRLESVLDAAAQSACAGWPALAADAARLLAAPGTLVALPRLGTVSPWASRALDILRRCGLAPEAARCVEAGVLWRLSGAAGAEGAEGAGALAAGDGALAGVPEDWLCDPMVEFLPASAAALGAALALAGSGRMPDAAMRAALGAGALAALRYESLWEHAEERRELARRMADAGIPGRQPTPLEVMTFAQIDSEHCRHHCFNACWTHAGEEMAHSLMDMIRNTWRGAEDPSVLSAYRDNAAVLAAGPGARLAVDVASRRYRSEREPMPIAIKAETHNHPTAIEPFAGAGTGAGGELRDEAAVGRGGRPKMGFVGFSVSPLRLPGAVEDWERAAPPPAGHLATPLRIMRDGPLGAAAFNNEFGRPTLCGYFRSYAQALAGGGPRAWHGYHKPIMLSGGLGNLRVGHVHAAACPLRAILVVLGGPALRVGLGGALSSSVRAQAGFAQRDFASVQRQDPEMQRRCQEVIDRCCALGDDNPIIKLHDVGAGGLSNALPELAWELERGADIDLERVPCADPGMAALEIWANESQERFVLAIAPESLAGFRALCERERCPFAVVGETDDSGALRVRHAGETVGDLPLSALFERGRRRRFEFAPAPARAGAPFEHRALSDMHDAARRVLRFPAVAAKGFLITIGDRSVGGLSCRDQMVGPWQTPVADAAVSCRDFEGFAGEAMALGERAPIASLNAAAAARMALGEALTNIASTRIERLADVKLSANWMAAIEQGDEASHLREAVQALGMAACPALGLTIPVGKDSLSMQVDWADPSLGPCRVLAPTAPVISAFAPTPDVRLATTPELRRPGQGGGGLLFVDLAAGRQRLGASALCQVHGALGATPADFDELEALRAFFDALQACLAERSVLAYHDRSDGGLFATAAEMCFASRCGADWRLEALGPDWRTALFNEELGAVVQWRDGQQDAVRRRFLAAGLAPSALHEIGACRADGQIRFHHGRQLCLSGARADWQRVWQSTSHRMQALRDNPVCADQEHAAIDGVIDADGQRVDDPGLPVRLGYDLDADVAAPFLTGAAPPLAVLREQGSNGHLEMAAAFRRAGFDCVDVSMSDLLDGRDSLRRFRGLAACGGFSFGDVLGAGRGWAAAVLHHPRLHDEFSAFFQRPDSFTLGVCNGCQMLAELAALIPGSDGWPRFARNESGRYEARLVAVELLESPSVLLAGMAGSTLPVVVSHGEGRAVWPERVDAPASAPPAAVMRYVDSLGRATESYPHNPNGSPGGLAGVCSADGRVSLMMPHPERLFRAVQHSWRPESWTDAGPWLRLFGNARRWLA